MSGFTPHILYLNFIFHEGLSGITIDTGSKVHYVVEDFVGNLFKSSTKKLWFSTLIIWLIDFPWVMEMDGLDSHKAAAATLNQ